MELDSTSRSLAASQACPPSLPPGRRRRCSSHAGRAGRQAKLAEFQSQVGSLTGSNAQLAASAAEARGSFETLAAEHEAPPPPPPPY